MDFLQQLSVNDTKINSLHKRTLNNSNPQLFNPQLFGPGVPQKEIKEIPPEHSVQLKNIKESQNLPKEPQKQPVQLQNSLLNHSTDSLIKEKKIIELKNHLKFMHSEFERFTSEMESIKSIVKEKTASKHQLNSKTVSTSHIPRSRSNIFEVGMNKRNSNNENKFETGFENIIRMKNGGSRPLNSSEKNIGDYKETKLLNNDVFEKTKMSNHEENYPPVSSISMHKNEKQVNSSSQYVDSIFKSQLPEKPVNLSLNIPSLFTNLQSTEVIGMQQLLSEISRQRKELMKGDIIGSAFEKFGPENDNDRDRLIKNSVKRTIGMAMDKNLGNNVKPSKQLDRKVTSTLKNQNVKVLKSFSKTMDPVQPKKQSRSAELPVKRTQTFPRRTKPNTDNNQSPSVHSPPSHRANSRLTNANALPRASSPLRESLPPFYNVRLSTNPVFLRRTTIRPPSWAPNSVPVVVPAEPKRQSNITRKQVNIQTRVIKRDTPEAPKQIVQTPVPEVQTRVIVHESIQTDPIKKTPPPVEKVLRNNYSIQSQTEPIEIMQPKIPIPIEAPVMRSPVVVQQFVQTEPEVIKSHVVVQESVQTDVEISEDESEEENVNSEIIYWMRSEILKRMNAKNFVKLDQSSSTSDLRIKYRDDGSSSILNSIVEDVSNEMCLQLIRQIMAEKISIDNESKYLRNSLIEEICLEMCRKVAMEVLDDLDSRNKIRDRACIFVSNSIMEEVCHELCHKVAREVLDEQEKVIIPDIPKPPSIRELFAHAGYIGICLIEEVSSEFCRQIAADAIKDWENWNLIISRVSHAIADALINEVCDKMCNEVAAEVLDDIVEDEEPILSEKSSLTLTSTLSTTVSQGEIFTELYSEGELAQKLDVKVIEESIQKMQVKDAFEIAPFPDLPDAPSNPIKLNIIDHDESTYSITSDQDENDSKGEVNEGDNNEGECTDIIENAEVTEESIMLHSNQFSTGEVNLEGLERNEYRILTETLPSLSEGEISDADRKRFDTFTSIPDVDSDDDMSDSKLDSIEFD